jgi:hypothetical protein
MNKIYEEISEEEISDLQNQLECIYQAGFRDGRNIFNWSGKSRSYKEINQANNMIYRLENKISLYTEVVEAAQYLTGLTHLLEVRTALMDLKFQKDLSEECSEITVADEPEEDEENRNYILDLIIKERAKHEDHDMFAKIAFPHYTKSKRDAFNAYLDERESFCLGQNNA